MRRNWPGAGTYPDNRGAEEVIRQFLEWIFGPPKPFAIRHHKWPEVRREHLAKEPVCQACGSKKNLIVHHRLPVHIFPDNELDTDNLITLCEGLTVNCHFLFGHCNLNWKCYNENVRVDVLFMAKLKSRRKE